MHVISLYVLYQIYELSNILFVFPYFIVISKNKILISRCCYRQSCVLNHYATATLILCKKSFKIPKRKGRQYNGQKKKEQSLIYKTLHRKLIISTIAIYFFTENKKKIFIFWTYKKSVISLQIFIIN